MGALGKIDNAQSRKALETLFKTHPFSGAEGQAESEESKRAAAQAERVLTLARLESALEMAETGDRDAVAILESLLNPSAPVHVRRSALAGLLKLDQENAPGRIVGVLRGSDAALKPVALSMDGRMR